MQNSKKSILLLLAVSLIAFHSCKKDDNNDNSNSGGTGTTGVTINSDPQVSFKVDGTSFTYKTGTGNVQQGLSSDGSLNTPPNPSSAIFGAFFYEDDGSSTIDHIAFDKGTFTWINYPIDSAAFSNYYTPQSYSYSPNALNGFEITYTDASSVQWKTGSGTGNQAGSTFVITDRKVQKLFGENYVRVKATFNCKVYNGLGGTKTITDGVVVMDYHSDY